MWSSLNIKDVNKTTQCRKHAPTNQPRQPFLSQSAVRQSANGARLISQFQWRKADHPARVIPRDANEKKTFFFGGFKKTWPGKKPTEKRFFF